LVTLHRSASVLSGTLSATWVKMKMFAPGMSQPRSLRCAEAAAGAVTARTPGVEIAATAGADAAGATDDADGFGGVTSCTAPRTARSAAAAATLGASIAAGLTLTTAHALGAEAAAMRRDAINESA